MISLKMKTSLFIAASCLFATGAYASPVSLSETQMDSVAAGGVEKVDGFVCPVITGKGVQGNEKFFAISADGTYYSFHGPDVSVPVLATNANGSGRPGGEFATPGSTDYTAIWGFRP